jgi:hypothetical protein
LIFPLIVNTNRIKDKVIFMNRSFLILTAVLFAGSTTCAQDTTRPKNNTDTSDISKLLEDQLNSEAKTKIQYVTAAFKTTRLIDGHSIENTAAGVLDVKISHRFGTIGGENGGAYNFFGLDNAKMRLGFDYGITNTFMIGIGHSTDLKTYDGFFKWKILRQSTGKVNMPISVSYVPTIGIISYRSPAVYKKLGNRVNFVHQIIVGRKMSEALSLQVVPTVIHRNLPVDGGPNDVYALGFGGRQKISKRTSFNAEYYYQLPGTRVPGSTNVLSFGFDIETGGHVFQVHITNSSSMTESNFITGNKGSWGKGDILFGFNISRVFTVGKKHTKTW